MRFKRIRLTIKQRERVGGYLFTLPFIVGFVFFFLYPFVQSFTFSLNKLELTTTGYQLHPTGLKNYLDAVLVNPEFSRTFLETVTDMTVNLPLILAFSFFAATILNQEFKGRALARVIFFLPVIYSAGVVLRMEQTDYITEMMQKSGQVGLFSSRTMRIILSQARFIPDSALEYVVSAIERFSLIVRASGIQILIFLAGLQAISPSLYEAAKVEGASGWESFWLITFPMISPLILTNTVYTIVDTLTKADNRLVQLIRKTAFLGEGYGMSSAMTIIYFTVIMLLLGIVFKVISKHVFYHE